MRCKAVEGDFGGLEGERGIWVDGSIRWRVDFIRRGVPPVMIGSLPTRSQGFFRKLVMFLDIKRYNDARAILLIRRGAVQPEDVQLASSFGIYVVIEKDNSSLKSAAEGAEVGEINQRTLISISRKSRSASGECMARILELLNARWLTARELQEELRWQLDPRTVYSRIRVLERKRAITVLGRTKKGEGIFGIPGVFYRMRNDLSAPSKKEYVSYAIMTLLNDKDRTYSEISESTGIEKHTVAAALRGLSRQGSVRRFGNLWTIRE